MQTHEEFREFIASRTWTFAKTMAHAPHEYTVKKNDLDEEFFDAVKFIRKNSHIVMFWKTPYQTYNADGWRYWSMGWPVYETILINRADIEVNNNVKGVWIPADGKIPANAKLPPVLQKTAPKSLKDFGLRE